MQDLSAELKRLNESAHCTVDRTELSNIQAHTIRNTLFLKRSEQRRKRLQTSAQVPRSLQYFAANLYLLMKSYYPDAQRPQLEDHAFSALIIHIWSQTPLLSTWDRVMKW
jgi:hypothetical protein